MASSDYVVQDPVATYDDSYDDQKRMLASLMAPAPASQLVAPSPMADHVAFGQQVARQTPTSVPRGTQLTPAQPVNAGSLPSQQPVPLATVQGNRMQSYNMQNGPQAQVARMAAPINQPDPSASLRPGGTSPVMPVIPPGAPQQVNPPSQIDADTARLNYLKNSGSGIDQIQNKPGRIAARIGDIALRVLAPGIEPFVPGTQGRNQMLVAQQQQRVGNDQEQLQGAAALADTQSQTAQRQAQAAKETAQAGADAPRAVTADEARLAGNPALEGSIMRPSDIGKVAVQSIKNSGQIDRQDDKDSYQAQNADSLAEVRRTQEVLNQARADAANADPNTPAGRMAIAKLASANAGHAAAMIRARAAMIAARGGYQGTDENDVPLNGIGIIGGRPVGTHVQAQATKNMQAIAKFNDAYSSVDNANAAIDEGEKVGAKFNTAAMAEALSDPKTTSAQWIAGKVNTTLNPQEQNIVITTKALREQINAMRSSVGGGVSDAQINRLVDQLPGPTTPSVDYARKQLATVRAQLDRLQAGLPGVNNGPSVQPVGSPENPTAPGGMPSRPKPVKPPAQPNSPPIPAGNVQVQLKSGQTGHIPAKNLPQFLRDNPGALVVNGR